MRPLIIAPSILAADFSKLGAEVYAVEERGADWLHIDVMDGHFVPNLSFGLPVIQSIRSVSKLPFDVHFMVTNPEQYIPDYAAAGVNSMTLHAEAGPHLHRNLQTIKALGKKAGVAINPGTPVSALETVVDLLDLILVMTVNPGFGGQNFIRSTLEKITQSRALAGGRIIDIEVDGGITRETAPLAYHAGANVLVAGSAIFKGDKTNEIKAIRNACAVSV